MIVDKRLQLISNTVVATGGPTTLGDQIDLYSDAPSGYATQQYTSQFRNLGGDQDMYLVIQVSDANSAAVTTDTCLFSLVTATATDLTTNAVTLLTTPKVQGTTVTTGQVLYKGALPMGDYKRYLGLRFTGTLTVGFKVDAFLTDDPAVYKMYNQANIG